MTDLRKAAEMALEALETDQAQLHWKIVRALRQALAQPRWVCCVCGEPEALGIVHSADAPCFHYTKREWVGLTRKQLDELYVAGFKVSELKEFAKAFEAKLKENNGY